MSNYIFGLGALILFLISATDFYMYSKGYGVKIFYWNPLNRYIERNQTADSFSFLAFRTKLVCEAILNALIAILFVFIISTGLFK